MSTPKDSTPSPPPELIGVANPDTPGQHIPGEGKVSFWESVRAEAATAARDEIKAQQPALQAQVAGYVQQVGMGELTGQGLPGVVPNITGTTVTGKELTIASARNRSFRTFVQGLGIDIGFALLSVFGLVLTSGTGFDFFNKAAWSVLAILVAKTVIQTAISYVARLKITPNYAQPPQ